MGICPLHPEKGCGGSALVGFPIHRTVALCCRRGCRASQGDGPNYATNRILGER